MNTPRLFVFTILVVTLLTSCDSDKPKTHTPEESVKKPVVNVMVPDFNADTTYRFIEKQVAFGPRIPGSVAQGKCAQWIITTLKSFADTVIVQDLKVELYNGKTVPCKNIIGSFNPGVKKRILLCAHWDTRPWSDQDSVNKKSAFDGADDGGSGVGILLEIARLIKSNKINVGIDIAFFDVEDYGPPSWEEQRGEEKPTAYCIGTQQWANHPHIENYRAYYGILLDMAGAKNARFPQEGLSLQYAPSVVKNVWETANSLGYGNYFIYEKTGAITDDHAFVNSLNGTPCIDIINMEKTSPTGFARHWHTQKDNMSIIDKATLKAVGQTLLQVIYSEAPDA
ncbi:MAG: M28 family peptidase [Chitinophagales bacterium]